MNKIAYAFTSGLVVCMVLTSCAKRRANTSYSNDPRSLETRRASSECRTVVPKIKSQKRLTEKLDGSEIFSKYNTAVFMIFTSNGEQGFQGSGFFINDHGLAVSNYHVFQNTYMGQEQIKLQGSNVAYKVKRVLAKSEGNDYIVFEVDCDNNNYLNIADEKPSVGEKVFAIGSPYGLENTFSSGEISQWRSDYVIQTDVRIDHGSSGGPLINEYGQVVGITSGTFKEQSQANLNYAWSIDVIKNVIK